MKKLLIAPECVPVLGACGGKDLLPNWHASTPSTAPSSQVVAPTPSPSTTTPPAVPVYRPAQVNGSPKADQNITIGGTSYPRTASDPCPTSDDLNWDATGYKTFTATVGLADNDPYALGKTVTVDFFDQDNHKLGTAKAALGKSQKATVDLNGAVRFRVACTIKPAGSSGSFVLGDGVFSTEES